MPPSGRRCPRPVREYRETFQISEGTPTAKLFEIPTPIGMFNICQCLFHGQSLCCRFCFELHPPSIHNLPLILSSIVMVSIRQTVADKHHQKSFHAELAARVVEQIPAKPVGPILGRTPAGFKPGDISVVLAMPPVGSVKQPVRPKVERQKIAKLVPCCGPDVVKEFLNLAEGPRK